MDDTDTNSPQDGSRSLADQPRVLAPQSPLSVAPPTSSNASATPSRLSFVSPITCTLRPDYAFRLLFDRLVSPRVAHAPFPLSYLTYVFLRYGSHVLKSPFELASAFLNAVLQLTGLLCLTPLPRHLSIITSAPSTSCNDDSRHASGTFTFRSRYASPAFIWSPPIYFCFYACF
ncbi:hypothetical protein EDB84DRAFT_1566443 [Lactarius hengduanensis]|nr:hypothetical protein EDB84DRAFT_1566443 [Lactarius hengduanensis]